MDPSTDPLEAEVPAPSPRRPGQSDRNDPAGRPADPKQEDQNLSRNGENKSSRRRGRPRKNPDAPPRLAATDAAALRNFDDLPGSALVSVRVIAALAGVGDGCVWAWVRAGKLSKPRKIGAQSSRWYVTEVRAFLAATNADADPDAGR